MYGHGNWQQWVLSQAWPISANTNKDGIRRGIHGTSQGGRYPYGTLNQRRHSSAGGPNHAPGFAHRKVARVNRARKREIGRDYGTYYDWLRLGGATGSLTLLS